MSCLYSRFRIVLIIRQSVTRFYYLVYASKLGLIMEKGTIQDQTKIPSLAELITAVTQAGYQLCQPDFAPAKVFQLTLCGPLRKAELSTILFEIKLAWQSDYSVGGGVGFNRQVTINYVSHSEFLSENK